MIRRAIEADVAKGSGKGVKNSLRPERRLSAFAEHLRPPSSKNEQPSHEKFMTTLVARWLP